VKLLGRYAARETEACVRDRQDRTIGSVAGRLHMAMIMDDVWDSSGELGLGGLVYQEIGVPGERREFPSLPSHLFVFRGGGCLGASCLFYV